MPLVLLLAGLAFAQDANSTDSPFVIFLDSAREAIKAKDWESARTALDQAYAVAPANDVIVLQNDLARLDFYRGVVEWYGGDRDRAALDAWRRAAVVHPRYVPDETVLPEVEAQDAFYAVSSEVRGYAEIDLALPDDPGEATIFVDGARRDVGDVVYAGLHYIQLRCEDGSLTGAWYTFGAPPTNWLLPCSGGTYATRKPNGRKPSKADGKPEPKPEPKPADVVATGPAEPPALTPAPDPGDPAPLPTDPLPEPGRDRKRGGAAGWVTLGAGAALLAGGGAVELFAFEPAWQAGQAALSDPTSITRAEADALESRYATFRYLSAGLLAAGGGTVIAGGVVVLVDLRVEASPFGVGLSGRW